jgi:hypothetical protein
MRSMVSWLATVKTGSVMVMASAAAVPRNGKGPAARPRRAPV